MKILMFGWEYSPQLTGGLGVVCKALCDELSKEHTIRFILPTAEKDIRKITTRLSVEAVSDVPEEELNTEIEHSRLAFLNVGTNLLPYLPSDAFRNQEKTGDEHGATEDLEPRILKKIKLTGKYDKNLSAEVTKYTLLAAHFYEEEEFDIIHAHDWMGANAALLAKAILKIPLVFHIHSTEYDRNGPGGSEHIRSMERKAIEMADAIVCVSSKTKESIIKHYEADESKIWVVPNAVQWRMSNSKKDGDQPTIGFLGRFTAQKAPGKFVDMARLLENDDAGFRYKMIGDGYLMPQIKDKIHRNNLGKAFELTGFLTPGEVKSILGKISLLVIPSVSEPFGLVALEATAKGVPVIISKNAGVNEFIPFKTFDQWDLHSMKDLALSLIENETVAQQYLADCRKAMRKLSWKKSAGAIIGIYGELTSPH
ncbi:MAG: glycosyltransferase family 4 protein [Cyclobacteriaceae bacterium]